MQWWLIGSEYTLAVTLSNMEELFLFNSQFWPGRICMSYVLWVWQTDRHFQFVAIKPYMFCGMIVIIDTTTSDWTKTKTVRHGKDSGENRHTNMLVHPNSKLYEWTYRRETIFTVHKAFERRDWRTYDHWLYSQPNTLGLFIIRLCLQTYTKDNILLKMAKSTK